MKDTQLILSLWLSCYSMFLYNLLVWSGKRDFPKYLSDFSSIIDREKISKIVSKLYPDYGKYKLEKLKHDYGETNISCQ